MEALPKRGRKKKADPKPTALAVLALEGVLVKCLGPAAEHWFRNDGTRGNRVCKACREKQKAMNLSPTGAEPVRTSQPGEPTYRWKG